MHLRLWCTTMKSSTFPSRQTISSVSPSTSPHSKQRRSPHLPQVFILALGGDHLLLLK